MDGLDGILTYLERRKRAQDVILEEPDSDVKSESGRKTNTRQPIVVVVAAVAVVVVLAVERARDANEEMNAQQHNVLDKTTENVLEREGRVRRVAGPRSGPQRVVREAARRQRERHLRLRRHGRLEYFRRRTATDANGRLATPKRCGRVRHGICMRRT